MAIDLADDDFASGEAVYLCYYYRNILFYSGNRVCIVRLLPSLHLSCNFGLGLLWRDMTLVSVMGGWLVLLAAQNDCACCARLRVGRSTRYGVDYFFNCNSGFEIEVCPHWYFFHVEQRFWSLQGLKDFPVLKT